MPQDDVERLVGRRTHKTELCSQSTFNGLTSGCVSVLCAGCGQHIDTALAAVPVEQRCQHKAATQEQHNAEKAASQAAPSK